MQRLTRLLVVGLVVAVGSAGFVECATADPLGAAQMACCGDVGHDCGPAAVEESCCPTDTSGSPQLSPSSTPQALPPLLVTMAPVPWVPPPLRSELFSAFEAFDREILKLPERATYLLVSTFLI